jgi:hypothetical protein
MSKDKEPKRSIRLNGINKTLELKKVSTIHFEDNDTEFIYIEKMKSGDWRLCYTKNTIPDISKLNSLDIIRED